MNLVRGTIALSGGPQFVAAGQAVTFPLDLTACPDNNLSGKDVFLGVRPEGVHVNPSPQQGVSAVIEELEPLGGETLVFLRAGSLELTARVAGNQSVARGDRVGVTLDQAALHWFDGRTEERI